MIKNEHKYNAHFFSVMNPVRSAIIAIHPVTRNAVLKMMCPSYSLALQQALHRMRQEIEISYMKDLIKPHIMTENDDAIQRELYRWRDLLIRHVDSLDAKERYCAQVPNIYTVIANRDVIDLE